MAISSQPVTASTDRESKSKKKTEMIAGGQTIFPTKRTTELRGASIVSSR
jgi:hypothetical protein